MAQHTSGRASFRVLLSPTGAPREGGSHVAAVDRAVVAAPGSGGSGPAV